MSIIKLAVDIDGVLSNTHDYWLKLAGRENITQPIYTHYNTIFRVRCADGKVFGEKLFGEEYLEDWLTNSKPFPQVKEFIEYLNVSNHISYHIVTSRNPDNSKDLTMKWLDKHGIDGYEDVLFMKNKTQAPCNAIIDDVPKHVSSYNIMSRLGMLMDAEHNLTLKDPTLTRYKDLTQVITKLKQYE